MAIDSLRGRGRMRARSTFPFGPGNARSPLVDMIEVRTLDPFRVLDGDELRDHAAHRRADHVGFGDRERVEETDRVRRHVVERIGRSDRQAKEGAHHHRSRRKPADRGHAAREASVPVVEADDAEAPRGQSLAERVRPSDKLHAQAHYQEYDRRVPRARIFIFNGDAVRPDCSHDPPSSNDDPGRSDRTRNSSSRRPRRLECFLVMRAAAPFSSSCRRPPIEPRLRAFQLSGETEQQALV